MTGNEQEMTIDAYQVTVTPDTCATEVKLALTTNNGEMIYNPV
jgi:hypothetical protein